VSADSWPGWTNAAIELFHGTILSSAEDIVGRQVDLSRCEGNSDFGLGFYTTTYAEQASIFAGIQTFKRGGTPAVVRIRMNRERLGRLRTIGFVRGSLDAIDYWSFVLHCRSGFAHMPPTGRKYDVAYGPVAKAWKGPTDSKLWEGYDQISFHTPEAIDILNDENICTLEIV